MTISSIHDILEPFHSRKLLFFPNFHQSPTAAATATPPSTPDQFTSPTTLKNILNANVVMVITVLLFALICSFCLNAMIRCALRCSSLISSDESIQNSLPGPRLTNTGVKKQALETFPVVNYTGDLKFPGLSECAICLSEFASGELIRVLPKCSHVFHVKCIDRWLNSHSSCPNCRHCLIERCHKVAGSEDLEARSSPAPQDTSVRIAPLEPEGFVSNHHS
ncbi:hypothetical protein Leryth_015674 [Lithospermum erythrorhizon]|nr:hypothetical protein Leryth_015674 [Lithospermum erythrorhizon]